MKAKLKGVTVYFSPAEYKEIKAEARRYRRTLSSFIREYHCGLPGMVRGAPKKLAAESPAPSRKAGQPMAQHRSARSSEEQLNGTLFELN